MGSVEGRGIHTEISCDILCLAELRPLLGLPMARECQKARVRAWDRVSILGSDPQYYPGLCDVTPLSLSFSSRQIKVSLHGTVRNSVKAQSYFHNSYR